MLTLAHPAHAVVTPGIAWTADQLVALNAITGWILSVGLIAAPAIAGSILKLSSPGVVYAIGAAASFMLFGRARIVPVLLFAGVGRGVAFVTLGISTTLPLAPIVVAVVGVSRSLLEVSAATLLQRVTPTALPVRTFAFEEGLTMGA